MSDEDSKALATMAQNVVTGADILMHAPSFEHGWRVAKMFASSQLIPTHLRDKPSDCLIALQMALRMNEDPLSVMQNIYIVSGKAGWSTTYMIARARRSGVFRGPIRWKTEGEGDAMKVTAVARLADIDEEVDVTVSMAMAKAEGWTKNAKYQSMPEHMLRWRSATMLIRLYAPEVMLGMETADEIEDTRFATGMRDVTPAAPKRSDYAPQPTLTADKPEPEAWEFVDKEGESISMTALEVIDTVTTAVADKGVSLKDRFTIFENNRETLLLMVEQGVGGAGFDGGSVQAMAEALNDELDVQEAARQEQAKRADAEPTPAEPDDPGPEPENESATEEAPAADAAPVDEGFPYRRPNGETVVYDAAAEWVEAIEGDIKDVIQNGASVKHVKTAWPDNASTAARIATEFDGLADRVMAAQKRFGGGTASNRRS